MPQFNTLYLSVHLDERREATGKLVHVHTSGNEGELDLGLAEDFLGLVVNLSPHTQVLKLGKTRSALPRAFFNFYFIPYKSCTLQLQNGFTTLLFIPCTLEFLGIFEPEATVITPF